MFKKSKRWSKIQILVKNTSSAQQQILLKNLNFAQKSQMFYETFSLKDRNQPKSFITFSFYHIFII